MNSFSARYPAFAALLSIIGQAAHRMAADGQTFIEKIENEVTLVPGVLAFISSGQGALLGAELEKLKASPEDMVEAGECLVTSFSFTSDKAKVIIPATFGVAEWVASGFAPVKALLAVI